MNSTRKETNPLKKRRFWWMESGFFWFIGVFYCGFSILVMTVLAFTLKKALIGLEIYAGFWLIILPIVIWFYKRTLFEHYSVDQSVVARTKRNLAKHRDIEYARFHQREIGLLERGQKTPVMDVWKRDQNYAARLPFIRGLNALLIDPVHRELQIRVELESFDGQAGGSAFAHPLVSDLQSFVRLIASDGHLKALRKYFAFVAIEVYAPDIDDRGAPLFLPVLSILMKSNLFWMVPNFVEEGSLFGLGEVRFDHGKVIVPHRGIEQLKVGAK